MGIMAAAIKFRATLFLAATLLLLGAVAGLGAMQLSHIISRQLRTDTATAICAALQSQQYEKLAAMVDPAPVPPLAAGAFDPGALETRLKALDQQRGTMTGCSWRPLQLNDESGSYIFTLRRAKATASTTTTVFLQHEPDNGWRISRESAFTTQPI